MEEKRRIILKAWSKMAQYKFPKDNKALKDELMGMYLSRVIKGAKN